MKKFQIVGILLTLLFMASCSTVQKTASFADISTYVLQYPTVADLEVSPQRVKKSTSWISLFSTTSLDTRKSNLTAELLESEDADVLIEPQSILDKNLFGTNTLSINGYPAKYKNFRKASDADLEAIKAGCRDICLVSDPCCTKAKPKKIKKCKKFLGIF